ncbi:MAG: hypothetical protein QM655_14165 [Nocardioidaceae bacterium]
MADRGRLGRIVADRGRLGRIVADGDSEFGRNAVCIGHNPAITVRIGHNPAAADGMSVGRRFDPDRELVGQGVANLLAPIFGGGRQPE